MAASSAKGTHHHHEHHRHQHRIQHATPPAPAPDPYAPPRYEITLHLPFHFYLGRVPDAFLSQTQAHHSLASPRTHHNFLYHRRVRPRRYYDPQIPTDEYGVKETEPIGWLAAAMQQQNSDMPAVAMQEAVRGRRRDDIGSVTREWRLCLSMHVRVGMLFASSNRPCRLGWDGPKNRVQPLVFLLHECRALRGSSFCVALRSELLLKKKGRPPPAPQIFAPVSIDATEPP